MIPALDRRYVLIPVVLSIALIVIGYVVVATSQARIREQTEQAERSQSRLRALGSVLRLATDAETGTRGYLLTDDPTFLEPFESADKEIEDTLDTVRKQYPAQLTEEEERWLTQLRQLVEQRMSLLRSTVAFQKENGQAASLSQIETGSTITPRPGKETMDSIRDLIRTQQTAEGRILRAITESSRSNLTISSVITIGGTVLNVLLVVVAGVLFTREINRRVEEGRALEFQNLELERLVAVRTADLSALSSYLQEIAEREKAALARELHDELGGLLIAAKMDISALRRKLGGEDAESRARWDRVVNALDAGVNLKRRVVDQLHPTLLDTMGLYSAIRWQFQESCGRAGLKCTESLPEHELLLSKEAAIAVFRVAQESMTNVLKHAKATAADLRMTIEGDHLLMRIRDDGVGFDETKVKQNGGAGWASMRHRVQYFGGTWSARRGPENRGTEIEVRLPLERIRAAAPA